MTLHSIAAVVDEAGTPSDSIVTEPGADHDADVQEEVELSAQSPVAKKESAVYDDDFESDVKTESDRHNLSSESISGLHNLILISICNY